MGDDPSEELARSMALEGLRDLVALRWHAIRVGAPHWHADQRENALVATREILHDLITIHGAYVEFSPDADTLVKMPGITSQDIVTAHSECDSASTSTLSSSSSACLDHVFKFVQTHDSVWTCLQA